MEAFEKWLLENSNLGIGCYEEQEETWKAALEWIYIEMTGTDLSRARDLIDKELED